MKTFKFLDTLLPALLEEIKKVLPEMQHELLTLARDIALDNASKIEKWLEMASSGELSPEDIEWLLASQLDLSRMNMLMETGLSKVQIDRLRQTFTSTIFSSIFRAVGI